MIAFPWLLIYSTEDLVSELRTNTRDNKERNNCYVRKEELMKIAGTDKRQKEHIVIMDKSLGLLSHLSPLLNNVPKFIKSFGHTSTQAITPSLLQKTSC
jgi:hypothetical protein